MQLEVVSLKNEVKLVMPDEVLDKIKYLCKSIAKVEWSGVLFYSIKGSIKFPKNMIITLEDILPMDMGTSAYTEYDIDDRYIDYMMDVPQAMEWHMGHIHSHNSMNVFFSGTDMSELNDNSENHNFYLSLIVNNYMDFTAKIGFRGIVDQQVTDIPYIALDEQGTPYEIETKVLNIKKEKMYVYDCNIVSKAEQILVHKGFAAKVTDIMTPKPLPVQKQVQPKNIYPERKDFRGRNHPHAHFEKGEEFKHLPTIHPDDRFSEKKRTPEELFTMCLLNFSNIPSNDVDVEDLLIDIEVLEINGTILSGSISDNIAQVYNRQFPFHVENIEHFIETVEETIYILEMYEVEHPVVCQSVGMLKEMISKFELYDTRE